MNARKSILATLAGCLLGAQSAWAAGGGMKLPVEDGGLLLVAVVALGIVVKIARGKQKR